MLDIHTPISVADVCGHLSVEETVADLDAQSVSSAATFRSR